MFKKIAQTLFTIGMFILFLSVAAFAQEQKKPMEKMKKMEKKMADHSKCVDSTKCDSKGTASAEAKIWNKVCPVMGEDVDQQVQTVEYNGKTIGFCCKGCAAKFKKNPEKYMKNLSEDGAKYLDN
ncbi:MAG: YHS domain-containing protein [Bacteroidetes bacterium]|nr:YHS domain-containing protein [Bacteroidota bacterium]